MWFLWVEGGLTGGSHRFLFAAARPGIGAFTIVDGHNVQASDLGNSFFLKFENLGKSRAEATTVLLNELNEYVNGTTCSKVRSTF